ncbi:transposase [Candidatus Berkelbacteria bacterium]|nr:transposase [Candidatus Berkelbacteria bacterium]
MLQDEDIILTLYCAIAETMTDDTKHHQAILYPSELVLCGVLFALKGGSFRGFYRWLIRHNLFPGLPERTRLTRLLISHVDVCNRFLGDPTLFTVLDSLGLEFIHPYREGRSKVTAAITAKGISNHRWVVGRKLAVVINSRLEIIRTADAPGNVHDNSFNDVFRDIASIILADQGFKQKVGTPTNYKICQRGAWNDRIWIETLFSLWTRICGFKQIFHRTIAGFQARVGYLTTLTNLVVNLNEPLGFPRLSLAQWSL